MSVIIPTRNGGARLSSALDGLGRTHWSDLDVIVVDNGSDDPATLELIDGCGAHVVRCEIPFNFSRLVNAGVRQATGKYLLLLNDDVEVINPHWLTAMVAVARRPGVGPVGALLLYPDGRVQHCGIDVRNGAPMHLAVGSSPDALSETHSSSGIARWAVTAACMLIERGLFERLGGFETLMHTSYNDVDFCLRAARIGRVPYLAGQASLIHHESASRGKDVTPDVRADWLMFRTRWAEELAARERARPSD